MSQDLFFDLVVKQTQKSLHNLDQLLDKAQNFADSKKFDVTNLLQARLAPDQFNFIRQVQITCDTCKFAASRFTGQNAPTHEDVELTVVDLRKRIQATIDYLKKFSPKDFAQADSKQITTPRWEGKHLTGREYLCEHVIPNFYFHLTTAYSILRHNGVDIGKSNYLGELPFKR